MSRLIVISNRVAVPTAQGASGAQGGLAGALQSLLRENGGLWFGWSGEEADDPSAEPDIQTNAGVSTATIDLEPQDIDEYYNGYANATLWPLFHYRLDLAEYHNETGRGYERVNDLFADRVAPLIEPDDTIWVHDYHFMPIGDRLRSRGFSNRIGFFLHIPWPPTRLLVSLPHHERLVRTMLHYDLVGFQSVEWLESFFHYCRTELGAKVTEDDGRIDLDGRTIFARVYPIGIDHAHFMAQGDTDEARTSERRLRQSTRDRVAMIGVDRLDYSKGLPERIDGIGRFFERDPERAKEVVFIQIAPPSRQSVETYQNIREVLERKTGRINGEYSEIDIVPIRYVNKGHSTAELFGCYRASKICLVTPLRDGMNLVAKEYIAAQDPDDPGVLILSRFAGAFQQLPDALPVNPHSADDLASAIQTALQMDLPERKARWERMNAAVKAQSVQQWAADFCHDLSRIEQFAD